MKKIFLLSVGLLASAWALTIAPSVLAATLNFDANTNVLLPSGTTLVTTNGSKAESLVVNDDSTLTLTLGTDSDITIQSPDLFILSDSAGIGTSDCSNFVSSLHIITTASQTVTVSVGSTKCSTGGGGGSTGGGGGGGAGVPPQAPTSATIGINGGKAKSDSRTVTVQVSATNATTMLLSNTADFSVAGSWQTYATTTPWTLTAGTGTKTVYVKFRSSTGGESAAVNDSIELVTLTEPTNVSLTGENGGVVELLDHTVQITFPAGSFVGSGVVTITPTTNFTSPTGLLVIIGDQVYDVVVTVGGSAIKTFSHPLTLKFTYTDDQIKNVSESGLKVYYWDTTTNQWVSLGGTVSASTNTITVTTNHFTQFAIVGQGTTPVTPPPPATTGSGQLVKLACPAKPDVNDPCKAVYFIGNNGKRYVFPNDRVYKTWYTDFSTVATISASEMSTHMIGGNVTYRPGVKMIKIATDPKVYAVALGGVLRWVATETAATALFGAQWNTMIDDVSPAFFVNYSAGSDVTTAADYDRSAAAAAASSINADKGL